MKMNERTMKKEKGKREENRECKTRNLNSILSV